MLKLKVFLSLTLFSLVFSPLGILAQTDEKAEKAAQATNLSAQTNGKNPVIIIPGVAGSQIINPKTGKTAWFNVKRDKEDDLRLPMTSVNLTRNRDSLVANDIIREVKLPGILPDVEVYQGVIDSLKAKGYTEADWNKPQASDVFYVFPYDWRRDNVETAQLLIQKIENAKRALKKPDLKFDIIAHSMGGLVARYAAMYGAKDLSPAGVRPKPTWAGAAHISKLLMFGTPNEGSFNSFDAAINGYSVVSERNLPFVDDFRPEDVLTSPATFQLMPHQSTARVFDENLQPLKVNLYDIRTWEKYGWGATSDAKFLSKLKDAARLAIKNKEIKPAKLDKDASADDVILSQTTSAQVRAYLSTVLSRANRFHIALDAPAKESPIEIYAFGGNCEPTLDAIVIKRNDKKDRWETLTAPHDFKNSVGKEFKKDDVRAVLFAPGDGRVTQRSLLAGSEASKGGTEEIIKGIIPFKSSFLGCGLHTKLFLEKTIQDSFLSALVVEKTAQP